MKGCEKEYIWIYDHSKLICGLNKWFCPKCSKSKSELDKPESREPCLSPPVLSWKSASGLTPKEKAIKNYLEHNAVIHQANGFVKMKYERFKELQNRVLEEQKKEELEFLKRIYNNNLFKAQILESIFNRIKQLEAKE